MTIEELNNNHAIISSGEITTKLPVSGAHTKLSIEFVISVLESMKVNTDDLYSDVFDTHVNNILKGKIQELKKYLDEI